MTSRLRFGQAQLPSGLKTTAGRSADANKTRSLCPFFDSMVACDVSTIISAPPAAINSVRAIAIEQRKAWLATNWHLERDRRRRWRNLAAAVTPATPTRHP
jgi:hypothetical protein